MPRTGYQEGLDLVLRDQNQVAKASTERRRKDQIRRRTEKVESSSGSATPDTLLTIYSPLLESQDVHAHQFFVSAYVKATRDPRSEHGFLELLPLLFDKLSSSSVLSLSLAALSHCFFGAWEPAIRNAERLTVQMYYTKALGALRKALQDPGECVSDEVLMAVCLLSFFEVSSALANSMPVPEASEIWEDPGQMPYNPATLLDTMRVQVAKVLAAAAEYASSGNGESLGDERRSKILSSAKTTFSRYDSWPSLVPQDWRPIALQRSLIPQPIIDAGVHGDHCDLYPSMSVCEIWLIWYTSRVRILSVIADFEPLESNQDAVLQMQRTADDIFAAVPYVLGSKSEPAGMYNTMFVYPHLPGETVSLERYRSAAAFGGLALWIPLSTLLDNMRYLMIDQSQFSLKHIRRLGRLYDVRMPSLEKPPTSEV
ncbi:MAG: hypothetical protein Q9211_002026 [Gyalolechia sp. 1 TL-2023]